MAGLLSTDLARWRWAASSQIGTSHVRMGTRKQDAFRCFLAGVNSSSPALVAIVCDGAGSAEFGGEGASVTCRILSQAIRAHFKTNDSMPTDERVWHWIDLVRDTLSLAADRRGKRRQAFASTVVMLVSTSNAVMAVHIGDGGVVGRSRTGEWSALSWPESGEYASTTYFVTDDPAPKLRISRYEAAFDAFAVFTDGIENLALDHKAVAPHTPFFNTMMSPLDRSELSGKIETLSRSLSSFLSGERVCSRTDDDKSVILASAK